MRRQTTSRHRIGSRKNRRTASRLTVSPSSSCGLVQGASGLVPYLVGIAAFCGGVVGVRFGFEALAGSERLAVHSIEVKGNSRVRREEVAAYAGVKLGDAILQADLDGAALRLRRHPWVQKASVRRRLPDRVFVTLVEYEPALVVALGELYLAGADGQIFKRLSAEDGIVLPVLTGIGRDEVASRPQLVAARIEDAVQLARAIDAEAASFGRLEELHWDADLGFSVVTRPGLQSAAGMRVYLGLSPFDRLKTASAALARLRQHHREPEVLRVDGLKNPGRVTARLRDSSEKADATFIAKAR